MCEEARQPGELPPRRRQGPKGDQAPSLDGASQRPGDTKEGDSPCEEASSSPDSLGSRWSRQLGRARGWSKAYQVSTSSPLSRGLHGLFSPGETQIPHRATHTLCGLISPLLSAAILLHTLLFSSIKPPAGPSPSLHPPPFAVSAWPARGSLS